MPTRNFQAGTNGRDPGTKTFTFKARSKGRTLAYNARCGPNRDTEGCVYAREEFNKIQRRMAEVPDDNGKTRRIKRRK